MAIRDRRQETDNPEVNRLIRKGNQHWEMAGCARMDGDKKDEARHTAIARDYDRQAAKVARTARREYQPKTGAPCDCKRGVQRDNCPNCEGTGMVIDFAALRKTKQPRTESKP